MVMGQWKFKRNGLFAPKLQTSPFDKSIKEFQPSLSQSPPLSPVNCPYRRLPPFEVIFYLPHPPTNSLSSPFSTSKCQHLGMDLLSSEWEVLVGRVFDMRRVIILWFWEGIFSQFALNEFIKDCCFGLIQRKLPFNGKK